MEWSAGQFIILDVLQSSAYNDTQLPGITTSGKSPMKIKKKKGLNKEPWGTPDGIAHYSFYDNSLFSIGEIILTPIQSAPEIPKLHNFAAGYYVSLRQKP